MVLNSIGTWKQFLKVATAGRGERLRKRAGSRPLAPGARLEQACGRIKAGRRRFCWLCERCRGFNSRQFGQSPRGDGLKNMRKRIAKIDGGFFLASAPGQGICLRLTFQLNDAHLESA